MSYLYDATGPVRAWYHRRKGRRERGYGTPDGATTRLEKLPLAYARVVSWDGTVRMHNSARGKGVVGCMQSVVGFYTRY
jgi:hypothetical protein